MKKIQSLLILILLILIGCEENYEKGEVLFCTNSYLGNCSFSIEISIDNTIIGTLTAASEHSFSICTCPDSACMGIIFEVESGSHSYYAKELNCPATNRVNSWTGNLDVNRHSCETIILDIIEY